MLGERPHAAVLRGAAERDAAAADRQEDPAEAVAVDPRHPPPRAVPDRGRRAVRRDRGRRRSGRPCRGSRTRRSRRRSSRRSVGARAARSRRGTDPDGDGCDGPLRRVRARPTAATPTCCSSTSRSSGADAEDATAYAQAVANELRASCSRPPATRRSWSTPTCGPRASRVRWCARSRRTPPTTPSGRRCGRRRRCSGPTRWSVTRACASGSPRWSTRCAIPPTASADADVVEIRRIKARVDRERLPRGADPHTHLKLGRGGLADIEWTVQLLQLRYAGRGPALRSPRTLTALDAAREAGLLGGADAEALDAPGARSAGCATRSPWSPARAVTSCPRRPRAGRGREHPGLRPGRSDEMVNDYLRTTRRARAVVDRVFWE